ncbi:MAG: hypothetical protein PWP28_2393 [Oceanotoga sp.]|uniref:hypothetical protein n=1 Tax=Oceanotoga sp. TaxID=2108366 RepID=UPI0026537FBF|nr:hypothetical protein [Oceanotoga sp.]MDN5343513.1 hypothetical protein [Oceanotoga sp.]
MKSLMQLKALIRNLSKEKNLNSDIVLRIYMMERILERIPISEFLLKIFRTIKKGQGSRRTPWH